jgi:dihydrofolate reductase
MKASAFIATSLDGYIARRNGELDWLFSATPSGGQGAEDYGYSAFIATVDTIVMGRHTFEKVLTFGAWPYAGKQVIVLTTRPLEIPEHLRASVRTMSGEPADVLNRLEEQGVRHVYVDGGATIQRFLGSNALDRLILNTVPVLIGDGISLFGTTPRDIRLRHLQTRAYPGGLVQSEYVSN